VLKITEREKIPDKLLSQTSDRDPSLILLRSKRNEPEAKKIKLQTQEEKVKERLETFVDSFIIEFGKRLVIYHLTAKGERLTVEALKAELKTGSTAALVGMTITQSLLGSLPSIATSIRTLSSQYYVSKGKAQTITKTFEQMPHGDLSSLLSDAAVEVFYSFESQFMQVTDKAGNKMAMEKLAEDAAARALNDMAENAKDNLPITSELITKGIVLGKSEKFFDPSIKNVRIRISGNILQDLNGKSINSANLYEKVGLVLVNTETELNKFYRKNDRPDSAEYGYRRLLSWEKQAHGELIETYQREYQQEIFPKQETSAQYNLRRYEYWLQAAAIKEESTRLLNKFSHRYSAISETQSAGPSISRNSILFDLRKPVENFTGRMQVIEELHKTLLSTRNTAVIAQAMSSLSVNSASSGRVHASAAQASVSGLGGIGKTQLALRYAEQYAADYDNNVLWINAETKGDLANSVRKLADKLNIEKQDRYGNKKEIEEILEEVYAYFSVGKSLFIFDNVENYREFEKFLPNSSPGNKPALLITSRYRNWENVANVVFLDVLTEEEGKALIKSALKIAVYDQSQDRKIKELTTLLQRLPLALQQAVSYITIQKNINSEFGIQDYLNLYKEKATEVLDFDLASYSNDPYAKTVFTTWQITLDKIRQDHSAGGKALEILHIMAYICPDDIANNFFLPLDHSEKLPLAIHLLKSYSMINVGSQQDKSTIHRLVQKVTRANLEKDQHAFKETAEKILKLTESFAAGKEIEFHYLHFLLHINLHAELTETLKVRASRRRILDIITYSEFDVTRLLYLLDTAYMTYSREEYLKFIGEALFVYTRYPFLLLLTATMNYLEERLDEGIVSKEDIRKVLDYKYEISDKHYRLGRLSPKVEERARQLDAVQLLYEFEEKIFPSEEKLSVCSSLEKRKKRSIDTRCLLSGEEQSTIEKQLQYQRIKQYLHAISRVSSLVSSGMFTKDTLSALLQGNFSTVAINFSLLGSSAILGEISNSLLTQGGLLTSADETLLLGKKLSLNGRMALSILTDEDVMTAGKRRFLGNSMKAASPFLARMPTVFFAYNLKNQIQKYKAGNRQALSGMLTNGVIVGIDGLESGVEAAEYLEVIEGVSEFTGPLGEAAVALVWLGSDIEHVNNQVTTIEKYVQLNEEEKVIQDIRAFFHFAPSAYIEVKASNNQRVQSAIAFLKKNTDIKRIIFSLGSLPSEVFLDKKIKLTLSDTMPDNPSEGSLFCVFGRSKTYVSSDQWIPVVPYPPFMNQDQDNEILTYVCKNAVGVEYLLNRTYNYTLIALGEGNHTAIGSADTPNIFLVSNGYINYTGGSADNLFLLEGNSISGMFHGGNGAHNKISLENFNQNTSGYVLVDTEGFICAKNRSGGIIAEQCGSGLQIDNIQQMDGRKNKQDLIYIAEKLETIDSYGGENNHYLDHIYITEISNSNPKIVLRNNVVVHAFGSNNRLESVNYRIPNDEIGETQVELLFTDPTAQRFYFDFSLDNLNEIIIQGDNVTFNLLFQNKTFNVIILDPFRKLRLFHDKKMKYPEYPINAYYIFQDTEIKLFNKNTIYVQLRSHKTLDEIVSHYPAIASRLNMALSIQLMHNETVSIGYEKHQVLYNNPWSKNHLIGNGAENVYVITAVSNTDKFPLPEVTLYKVHEGLTDTLDLRWVVQQAKQECPEQEVSLSVSQHEQDLVMTLNAHAYLVSNHCVNLMTTWPMVSVRLKNTLVDNWYQNLDIVLHHFPMNIIANNQRWSLERLPLVFNNDKDIIILADTDIEKESELIILKKMGRYTFIRNNNSDLMLSNVLDSNTTQRDLCTIIYSQFYRVPEMKEKALSTTITFIDQQIIVKNHMEQINHATNFDTINQMHPTNRSSRRKRQVDRRETMSSKADDVIDKMADQYLDQYGFRSHKMSHSHKKIMKNRKSTYSLPEAEVREFEFNEKKSIHPHLNSKPIHRGKANVKSIQLPSSKSHMQKKQSVVTGAAYSQSNWFTPKPNAKKLRNDHRPIKPIKYVTDKQHTSKLRISRAHPLSPKLIAQQEGVHHQRLPLSRVTAAPDFNGMLIALNVYVRSVTQKKNRQPISEQIARQKIKVEKQQEINNAKIFRLPRPQAIEIKARGFGLR
jgi:NB-ARC domain